MRVGPERMFWLGIGAVIVALCPPLPLYAQAREVSVPFVGCALSGQTEKLEAPHGTSRSVPLSAKDAQALAYYQSAADLGLLAPRGWYCEGVSGSSGYALFVSPRSIEHGISGWKGLEGMAIELNHMMSGASGRYEIAEIMARVFPAYRALAARVLGEMEFPLPVGPYPHDSLKYWSRTTVEYRTPAQSEGLGNFHSWLGRNELPISGVAILTGDTPRTSNGPDVVLLSVRVPPALAGLVAAIVSQVERDTVHAVSK